MVTAVFVRAKLAKFSVFKEEIETESQPEDNPYAFFW